MSFIETNASFPNNGQILAMLVAIPKFNGLKFAPYEALANMGLNLPQDMVTTPKGPRPNGMNIDDNGVFLINGSSLSYEAIIQLGILRPTAPFQVMKRKKGLKAGLIVMPTDGEAYEIWKRDSLSFCQKRGALAFELDLAPAEPKYGCRTRLILPRGETRPWREVLTELAQPDCEKIVITHSRERAERFFIKTGIVKGNRLPDHLSERIDEYDGGCDIIFDKLLAEESGALIEIVVSGNSTKGMNRVEDPEIARLFPDDRMVAVVFSIPGSYEHEVMVSMLTRAADTANRNDPAFRPQRDAMLKQMRDASLPRRQAA